MVVSREIEISSESFSRLMYLVYVCTIYTCFANAQEMEAVVKVSKKGVKVSKKGVKVSNKGVGFCAGGGEEVKGNRKNRTTRNVFLQKSARSFIYRFPTLQVFVAKQGRLIGPDALVELWVWSAQVRVDLGTRGSSCWLRISIPGWCAWGRKRSWTHLRQAAAKMQVPVVVLLFSQGGARRFHQYTMAQS